MPNKFELDGDNEKVFKVIKPGKKPDNKKKELEDAMKKAASDKKDGDKR